MRGVTHTHYSIGRVRVAFAKAAELVEGLDEAQWDTRSGKPPRVRCHELARAVGRVLGLPVQDGNYTCVAHSWLLVPDARRPRKSQLDPGGTPGVIGETPRQAAYFYSWILDVYAVGRLPMVQLVDIVNLPGAYGPAREIRKPADLRIRYQYEHGPTRDDIDEAVVGRLTRQLAPMVGHPLLDLLPTAPGEEG